MKRYQVDIFYDGRHFAEFFVGAESPEMAEHYARKIYFIMGITYSVKEL